MRMTDMKRSRFTEEQIINFIKQAGAGMPIRELCRKGGFSDATPNKWRAKFGRMDVPDAKRLWGISKVRYQDLQKNATRVRKNTRESHTIRGDRQKNPTG